MVCRTVGRAFVVPGEIEKSDAKPKVDAGGFQREPESARVVVKKFCHRPCGMGPGKEVEAKSERFPGRIQRAPRLHATSGQENDEVPYGCGKRRFREINAAGGEEYHESPSEQRGLHDTVASTSKHDEQREKFARFLLKCADE